MHDLMAVIKALADETRVRVVMALQGRELCVCQMVGLTELAPSTVSKHMSILKQARLVESRKQGRWMFYRLADADVPPAASEAVALLSRRLADDPRIRQDTQRLNQILKLDREELCRRQSKC